MSLNGGTPGLADVFELALDGRLRGLHVALPGKVTEYDATTQTATVQPTVQQAVQDPDGFWIHETLPEIYDVPVMFMRSPSFTLTFPIPVGTTGQLLFNERDIGQWRHTGQIGSPGDQRCHSLAGAVFFPTMAPDADVSSVSATHAVVGLPTSAMLLVGAGATEYVALANLVLSELQSIRTAFNAHTHPFVATGAVSPTSAPTTPMAAPGSVAATKLKSE